MIGIKHQLLVIDDDQESANIFELVLTKLGHEAFIAGDVPTAMAYLAEHVPSMILLDIMLPGQLGLDVLVHTRQTPHLQGVPVVIISAHSLASYPLPDGIEADAVLRKPIRVPELRALLVKMLAS